MDQKEIVHEYRDLCALAALLEPVDADHQRPVSDTLAEAAHVSGAIRAGRLRGDRANIDTNREHLRSHCTPKGLPNTAPKLLCSGPAPSNNRESHRGPVAFGSRPDRKRTVI